MEVVATHYDATDCISDEQRSHGSIRSSGHVPQLYSDFSMAFHIQDLQDKVHLAASVVLSEILGLRNCVAGFGVEESFDERGLASS
jgi:hypothetical protein